MRAWLFMRSKWIGKFNCLISDTKRGIYLTLDFSICFLYESKANHGELNNPKPQAAIFLLLKLLMPRKVFLFWAGFGRDHFEINSCKLTFPNIPSFQGRARVFRRSREKEPMQPSRSFLGVWLWPRSSAAAQAWSRLEDPFWPGSPWLSLPSWPCCGAKLGIWTKGDTAVNQIAGLFSVRTPYACPLGVPLPRRLGRTWPSHLPLPSPMAARENPQSLFSNLKADSCILQNLFLKELLSHAEFQDAFCPLFTCSSECRLCPPDAFLCFFVCCRQHSVPRHDGGGVLLGRPGRQSGTEAVPSDLHVYQRILCLPVFICPRLWLLSLLSLTFWIRVRFFSFGFYSNVYST